jgi:hypothetical protein
VLPEEAAQMRTIRLRDRVPFFFLATTEAVEDGEEHKRGF